MAQTKSKPENQPSVVTPYKQFEFDQYITFRALGGLIIDAETDEIKKINLKQFCEMFKVDISTTWYWRNMPDLAKRIDKRREEIMPLARVSAVWNNMFLLAMQNKDKRAAVEAGKTFLGHFGHLKLPTQPTQLEAGESLIDFIKVARKRNIIEGEVADGTDGINA